MKIARFYRTDAPIWHMVARMAGVTVPTLVKSTYG
jgi:hypothetical protein